MNETRRGFLKTLGKLGAVLGLTFAACSAHHSHHPHHPHPHHRKHPKPPKRKSFFDYDLKANGHTTQQAKTRPSPVVTFGPTPPNVPNGRYGGEHSATCPPNTMYSMKELEVKFFGFKKTETTPLTYEALKESFKQASNAHVSDLRNAAVLTGITD